MLHPFMLLGLLGLGVPVIIHLIQRQRLRPQMLATLRFLDREDLANAFAPTPRDPLQLLLRLALMGLFVLFMGRLTIGHSEPGPRTLTLVLDQSMSMRQLVGERETLFERCRRQALELVDSMRDVDRMAFVLVGDETTVSTGLLADKLALRAIVERAEQSDSGGSALAGAIRQAIDQLRSRKAVNSCVVVFSDHQRLNYDEFLKSNVAQPSTGSSSSGSAAGDAPLAAGDARVLLVDQPTGEGANLSVQRAAFSPARAFVGASSRVTAEVRNHSDEPQTANVVVRDGETTGEQRPLTLAPGETARIDLVQRFESPLDTVAQVELPDDALPGDNRFFVPMRMRERRQVLLVASSDAAGEAAGDDADQQDATVRFRGLDLLTYAMNPGEALGQGGGTNVTVKRVTPQTLQRVSLPLYSLVVVYGVADLPEQSRKDLRVFVAGGGGLWLIPDAEASPARLNETFGELLGGAAFGQLAQVDTPRPLDAAESSVTSPLFLPLLRGEWGPLSDLHFHRYLRLESPGAAQPALRAANGDVLAALARFDRGLVLLSLFPCDLDSTTLPRSAAFVPYVQQVVATLGERVRDERLDAMRVGQTLRMRTPEFRNLQGDVQVEGPASRRFPLTGEERDEVRLSGLPIAGDYRVTHVARPNGRQRRLAVNPVEGESDLARLSEEEQTALFGVDGSRRLPFDKLAEEFSPRRELAPWLALAVLAALVVESLAGAWQSRRGARQAKQVRQARLASQAAPGGVA